jgi:hypothetical protein
MSLDETVKAANVGRSIKKYMIDNLSGITDCVLSFDGGFMPPSAQIPKVKKWVSINGLGIRIDNVSDQDVRIICCTREDKDGENLAALRDEVAAYFQQGTSISLYRIDTWAVVGHMVIYKSPESGPQVAVDGTKFWVIPITLKWGAKAS